MIYDTLYKGEDGLYHTKAFNDEKKRHFVQLNGVKVVDVDHESGEVSLEITGEHNQSKIESVHTTNIESAIENSKTWFGKELSEKTVSSAYTRGDHLSVDKITATRVFNHAKEPDVFESIVPGVTCTMLVEFHGLWFAKKAFGPSWNIVQVKIHEPESEPEPEPEPEETYPDQYIIEDTE